MISACLAFQPRLALFAGIDAAAGLCGGTHSHSAATAGAACGSSRGSAQATSCFQSGPVGAGRRASCTASLAGGSCKEEAEHDVQKKSDRGFDDQLGPSPGELAFSTCTSIACEGHAALLHVV